VQALLPKLASCYKIIDRKSNFIHTLDVKESRVGNFVKVGLGHFTSDSAALPNKHTYIKLMLTSFAQLHLWSSVYWD